MPESVTEYEQVNHPAHYQLAPGIEAIDVCERLSFNTGNAVKYLIRAGSKPGASAETDLRKAIWYAEREIARLKGATP